MDNKYTSRDDEDAPDNDWRYEPSDLSYYDQDVKDGIIEPPETQLQISLFDWARGSKTEHYDLRSGLAV